ncbi:hypothetical protein B0A52_06228 [Exophiala mesophila]|uniref:RNA-binding protein n=1 Tax=Exophiala mesophila TaxID=212818 RepID=A0A438N2U8_EXOME|nr:hypothetical protein B0A52_06228 [Exophiala mesophila]
MSSFRSRGGPPHSHYGSSYAQPRDDFYDDRPRSRSYSRSMSRSRSRSRSPNRNYGSPHIRKSPPHDASRSMNGPSRQELRIRGRGSSPARNAPNSRDGRDSRYNQDDRGYYRSPSPRRGRQYYDRDIPRGPLTYSRSRSRSRSRGRDKEKPSKEIMMEGLAAHLTENDISAELHQHYRVEGLEDVRVIKDRQSRQSRGFGFLRFSTIDHASAFMDQNYPILYLYGDSTGSNGDACRVRIMFGRERNEPSKNDDPDWICPSCRVNNFPTRTRCFKCQTDRPDPAYDVFEKPANVGDNDTSPDNTPSQFLLLRGIEPSVSEELFAKGVAKLNKPTPSTQQTQQDQPSAKKGAKVASTTGDANLGAKEGTLRRVLLTRDRRTHESWRFGFAEYASIEDAQAALIRFNSFDRFTIASKQVQVSYIHAGVFVPVVNPSREMEKFTFSPLGNPAMKLAYWDENAYLSELGINMTVAPSSSTTTEDKSKTNKDSDKVKKRKAQNDPETAASKKPAPSHLQFWSNRHAELHGIGKNSQKDEDSASENNDAPPLQSFADPQRNCCYLCMRQFQSTPEVNRHERLSELHRKNLQDPARVSRAVHKLEKHEVQSTVATPTSQYRDRAKERRKVYGVVNKKGEQVGIPRSSRSSSDDEASPMVQSKGASLLSKMGYTAGQGLGASGEGMKAPISQDVYVAGVGLGAEGGKVGDAVAEAERNTKGDYSAFLDRTREGARERYARLG